MLRGATFEVVEHEQGGRYETRGIVDDNLKMLHDGPGVYQNPE